MEVAVLARLRRPRHDVRVQRRVVERRVDPDAVAALPARAQGGEDRERRAPGAGKVRRRQRRHARGRREQPRDRLVGEIVAGARRERSRLAVAADRTDHQTRKARTELDRSEPEARQGARAKALDQHVGAGEECQQGLAPALALEVERDALDTGEQELGERALPVDLGRRVAHRIAGRRLLDLDHPRAEVAQQPRGVRARQVA